jgi:group II intron reverse transcriptase/maturase
MRRVYDKLHVTTNTGAVAKALREGIMEMKGGWVIDADITGYFDNIDHGRLREILDQRVRDGVLRRTIDKWLNAGVMEDGQLTRSKLGTPQGGVVSPMLSNIYLHVVLDRWFENEVRPRLHGRALLIRFADDFAIVCEYEHDARRVLAVLPKRMARFGLTIHPEKTKLVDMRRPPPGRGKERRATFDLLGFTHYWGKSRNKRWVVKRKTARSRFNRTVKQLSMLLKRLRHRPVREQHGKLCQALLGHDAYYGITGNGTALALLRWKIRRIWRKWLDRRSRKANMNWEKYERLLQSYPLPVARVVHSIYGRQLEFNYRVAKP